MDIFKFEKESNGNWYVVLPDYPGEHGDLQMVAGADTLLDVLSDGGNEVSINLSTTQVEGFEKLTRIEACKGGGALYNVNNVAEHIIWLCDVMKYVFDGGFPEEIYFKTIE